MHDSLLMGHRRQFLRTSALSLGGLTFSSAAPSLWGSDGAKDALTGKTVIFLFMQGGPSQFETFDPKPEAPEDIRTVGGVIQTAVPGLHFGATFDKLASRADKLAVIRSFTTGTQHGGLKPIVSELTSGASLGAVYSRVAGATKPQTGAPTSACLFPSAVDEKEPGARDRFGRFDTTGPIGAAYAPFIPGGGGTFQSNLKLKLSPERLEDRQQLLKSIDSLRRDVDAPRFDGIDGNRAQAAEMLLKGAASTFDLSREPQATIARYDTSRFLDPKLWGTKKNAGNYTAHVKTLGKLLLLARRLAEAGTGFITINTEFVWDMHADGNNVAVDPGMKLVGSPFDHAVAAFIDDVEARGLSDRILLVCCGEMGRTPKINKNGGRDHWPKLAPLLMYGGGMTRGQIVGQSTKDGSQPTHQPLEPKHLLATIAHTLFDVGIVRVIPGLPKEIGQMISAIDQVPSILGA